MRTASIARNTNETQISLTLNLDGSGNAEISTGLGFFDHMLTLFTAHSLTDLTLSVKGDLYVDGHHTVEDTGITLGQAFAAALDDKKGICRYGHFTVPMDETLVTAAVDFCGRNCFVYDADFSSPKIGLFDTELVHEFWQGFAAEANCNLHIKKHYGTNGHHIAEAIFKAVARAIRMAVEFDTRQKGIPSTKGTL
ncbi:imidazoleglycerol-phosphate dehydratase [Planctomycetales bacterium]|nr:imidazoleglycerol-phosphate dehydratase [Planctomycetales bacterium]